MFVMFANLDTKFWTEMLLYFSLRFLVFFFVFFFLSTNSSSNSLSKQNLKTNQLRISLYLPFTWTIKSNKANICVKSQLKHGHTPWLAPMLLAFSKIPIETTLFYSWTEFTNSESGIKKFQHNLQVEIYTY